MFSAVAFGKTRSVDLPCVYLMADWAEGSAHRIHYAGQTHCLSERFAGHHRLAAAIAVGASHALVLVIQSETDRLAFETVLRWHFRPPLNEEAVPTHMQAWRAAQHCGKAEVAARAKAAHLGGAQALLPPRYAAMAKTAKR
jgi:hypothetical protein